MSTQSRRCPREPRPHERIWQDRCVDKNLKDEWLIHLNNLQAFDLISICEGHNRLGRGRSGPHINLRLKEEIFHIVSKEWHISGQIMSRLIDRIFSSEHSTVDIELNDLFRKHNGRCIWRQQLSTRIQYSQAGIPELIKIGLETWFENIIAEIKELDKLFADKYRDLKPSDFKSNEQNKTATTQ